MGSDRCLLEDCSTWGDEIKTCVETLSTCSNRFRGMNDKLNNNDPMSLRAFWCAHVTLCALGARRNVTLGARTGMGTDTCATMRVHVNIVLNEFIDQTENVCDKEENNQCSHDLSTIDSISLDYNLLNELLIKKLTFNEYLNLLDHLIDKKILNC
ncbi:unnamed protein product [Rotaria magnacalcarata]|uniref:Uncharacterized protein n=1 Tax=Rotaria magnacalcarata TaxID=392030 RepID=A0A820N7H6_9BILA|nr:unnamed protein product [Rotaria magnacalcarata]CAF4297771.1 unnamed protein product [Rotaria magnacalcarata]CAF4332520.1 unnamed protein product [Rotaria magnacalcarata]CAF4384813.1 unnamed protein product [Rotaria magnacalcarata]CAF4768113.1 unnamed protein product [Rotaria magnacalcarata]